MLGVVYVAALESDRRRQLMHGRVLRSRVQDSLAKNRRTLDLTGAEFHQNALKLRLSTRLWFCHRILKSEIPPGLYDYARLARREISSMSRSIFIIGGDILSLRDSLRIRRG